RVLASLTASDQRLASLEHERLDLLGADAQDSRDLLLGMVTQLEEDEGRALVRGQPAHVIEHLPEVLTSLDLVSETLEDRLVAAQLIHADRVAACAQLRQAAVAGD